MRRLQAMMARVGGEFNVPEEGGEVDPSAFDEMILLTIGPKSVVDGA